MTRKLTKGVNDLSTLFPDVAKEAYQWDPSTVTCGSGLKKEWKCEHEHIWQATIANRTFHESGCPFCAGQKPIKGHNDLLSLCPDIAKDAYLWDPSQYCFKSSQKKEWKCQYGHIWSARIKCRVNDNSGCPICSGRKVLAGFNDLATLNPLLASQSYGWDPCTVRPGSKSRREWQCSCGHVFQAPVCNRTKKIDPTGCPECCKGGYKTSQEGWLYLVAKPDQHKIGITNNLIKRIKTHEKHGWTLLDCVGPANGLLIYQKEYQLKLWLKQSSALVPGSREAWHTSFLSVSSLSGLSSATGIALTMDRG